MADYLVQEEDGTSKFTLEDGSGSILLEDGTFIKARISQDPVEALVLPDNAKARLSQDPLEVLVLPTDTKARVSQLPVEVLVMVNPPHFQGYIID